MAVLFVYLIFFSLHEDVESACELQCSPDKPYCSDVGCIFECPEPFYINGSECVSTCGEWFVDEYRHCVETCPIKTFYQEQLKQIQSAQYLERKCVRCNRYNQFIFNGSCVRVCPAGSRYIDKQNCTNECPSDKPFTLNITLITLVHHKCVAKCPHLAEDSNCRTDCSGNKVIHNSICIEQCPPTSPFLYAKDCLNECPRNAPSVGYGNNTCLNHKCPDERPYVVNNTCVERCPDTLPVFYTNGDFSYCVESCENGLYRLNDRCFSECPPSTVVVNDSCQEKCPAYTPFSCVISKGLYCGQRPKNELSYAVCVHECPSKMFIWNQTCMFSCPDKVPAFGNECTNECPPDFPLQNSNTKPVDCRYGWCRMVETIITCVKECPSNSVLLNNTCLSNCPSPLLLEGNRCKSTCSDTKPFIIKDEKVVQRSWSYTFRNDGRHYREEKQAIAIYRCTSSCGDDMVIWNSTCVKSCPENAPYVHNKTCSQQNCRQQYSEVTKSGTVCLAECRDHQVIYNRTCVNACPETFKYLNKTCVDQCPKSRLFTIDFVQGERVVDTCIEVCPDGLFAYKNTCLSFCHKPLFTLKNTCVQACPIDSPFSEMSSLIVETWVLGHYRLRKTSSKKNIVKCVSVCSEGKALFDSKCVDSCPAGLRYLINNTCVGETCSERYKYSTALGIRCFTECPEDLFINKDTCVLQCPDDLFVHRENCVSECPPTHGLIYEGRIGRNEFYCTNSYFKESGFMCAHNVIDVKKCQRRCPDNKFLYKNRCLDSCSYNHYIFNGTCVETCPISHPFLQSAYTTTSIWKDSYDGNWFRYDVNVSVTICVKTCFKTYAQFKSECVKYCPFTDPFVLENVCIKKCPDDKLLDKATKTCVDKCARDKGLFNKTCNLKCPTNLRYIHNSQCMAECPSSAPVALEEERFVCRASCPDDKLFSENGQCIYEFQCDEPMFEYNGFCISRCPEGFVWFHSCHDTKLAMTAIPCLAIILLVVFAFSWQTLEDFYRITKLVFVSEEELKKIEANQRKQYKKPVSKEQKEDEYFMRQIFYVAECDAGFGLQMGNVHHGTDITSETVL